MQQISETALWGTPRMAKYSRISHHFTILQALKAGRVRGARCIGGRWVIERADLDAWLATRRSKTPRSSAAA